MNISDELRKLQELHQDGALTNEEFAAAKAAVLAGDARSRESGHEAGLQEHIDEIKHQNELARLDREWQLERERYMIAGKYGYRYIPSRGTSLLGGVVIVAFGIFWTFMAASMGGGFNGGLDFFPLFGVIFMVAGAGMSLYSYFKASQYEQAYEAYQSRRARLEGRSDQTDF